MVKLSIFFFQIYINDVFVQILHQRCKYFILFNQYNFKIKNFDEF